MENQIGFLKQYYHIDDSTVNAIGEFSIVWALFERDKCNQNCSPCKLRILSEKIIESEELKENCNFFREINQDLIIRKKSRITDETIQDLYFSQETNNQQELIDFLMRNAQDWKSFLTGAMLLVYRIRNNMLHGLKDEYDLNKQKEIFIKGSKLLHSVLLTKE